MKKFKAILKDIGIGAGIFLGFFVAAFLVLFLGLNILHEKSIIDSTIMMLIVLIGSLLIAIISVITFFIKRKKNKHKYFSATSAKIMFYFFLFQGFINAFKSEIILTTEAAQKLIEMEWMIFSIAITLFVVWHAIVSKMLNKKLTENNFGYNRLDALLNKHQVYSDATNFIYNLVLLTVSLFCLIFTTPSLYINDKITYLNQFILIFNITIVINAVMVIFYDITTPLLVELWARKKYKMTDKQAMDEMVLAVSEETIKDAFKDSENKLTEEQITFIAKEIFLKISNNTTPTDEAQE